MMTEVSTPLKSITTADLSNAAKGQTLFEQVILNAFEAHFRNLKGSEATRRNKQQAFDRFSRLGFPNRKQEAYKYVNLPLIQDQEFINAPQPELTADKTKQLVEKLSVFPSTNYRVVLVNGHFIPSLSRIPIASSPFTGCWIQQANLETLNSCETSVAISQLIGHEKVTQSLSPFLASNIALSKQAIIIQVPEGQKLEDQIQLIFVSTAATSVSQMTHPLVLLKLAQNSTLHLNSYFIGLENNDASSKNTLQNLVLLAELEANSQLENDWLIAPDDKTIGLVNQVILSKKDSLYRQTSLTLSGQMMRQSTRVEFLEGGAHASLNGISLLSGATQSHDHIHVMHNVPGCTSDQVFKVILQDTAIYDFDGSIIIPRHAIHTEANQLNKNLLLSDSARVYTRPQLKIDADDVKCSHGATVGQLNDSELFYLKSRGISEALAKSMLTVGFANSVLQSVENPRLKQYFSDRISQKLAQ